MMKHTISTIAVLCFTLIFAAPHLLAANIWEMAESDRYRRKAPGMFGRGLLNAASSPVDIFAQTVAGARENNFMGGVGGFAQGSVCTIFRAASGIVDVATFWVPGFNGIPVSRSYENCLDFGGKQDKAPTYVAPPVYQTQPSYIKPAPTTVVSQPAPVTVRATPVTTTPPVAAAASTSGSDDRMKYIKK